MGGGEGGGEEGGVFTPPRNVRRSLLFIFLIFLYFFLVFLPPVPKPVAVPCLVAADLSRFALTNVITFAFVLYSFAPCLITHNVLINPPTYKHIKNRPQTGSVNIHSVSIYISIPALIRSVVSYTLTSADDFTKLSSFSLSQSGNIKFSELSGININNFHNQSPSGFRRGSPKNVL